MQKEKTFDIMLINNQKHIQRKVFSYEHYYNTKNKKIIINKIFSVFSQKIYEMVNIALESITSNNANTRYLALISNLQTSVRNIVKSTLVSLFETLDTEYRNSKDRLLYYYINKTNVKRTIITVVGEISFERTYTKIKIQVNTFSTLIHYLIYLNTTSYDSIAKGIAINNAFQTSQAQSARSTTAIISDITYFSDYDVLKDIPRQSIFYSETS